MYSKNYIDSYKIYLTHKLSQFNENSYLKEFEKLNNTTESIYDLGELDVLIILKDKTNLTDWSSVKNKNEVIYVSENLSKYNDVSGKYSGLKSLKAVVISGFSHNITNAESMFYSCESLVDISYLKNFDVSNVRNMKSMFFGCKSLKDLSALENWNVSKVENMQGMFNSCWSLDNLNALHNWDVSNVSSMNHMFYSCRNLGDLSALCDWNVGNVENMNWMFCGCKNLVDLNGLDKWNVDSFLEINYMFMGCESLKDISGLNDWNLIKRATWVFYGCKSLN